MTPHKHAIIEAAIASAKKAEMSATIGGTEARWTVQFEPGSTDRAVSAVLLEGPKGPLDKLAKSAPEPTPAEVSFLAGESLVLFDAPVLDVTRRCLMGRAVTLGYPAEVRLINRRNSAREPVPDGMDVRVEVRAWPGVTCRAWDLSLTGAALLCPNNLVQGLEKGTELEFEVIVHGREHIRASGKIRNGATLAPQLARLGLTLTPLDTDSAERLQRLVGRLKVMRETRLLQKELGGRRVGVIPA